MNENLQELTLLEMNLCERLAAFRKASGLSQEEVGKRLVLSRQAISGWENGSAKPSVENLIQLCRLYGVSLGELTGTPEPKYQPQPAAKKRNPLLIPLVAAAVVAVILSGILIGQRIKEAEENRVPYIDELPHEQIGLPSAGSFDVVWP